MTEPLQPAQASVVEMTRAFAQLMGELGILKLRYVSPGGDEIFELERPAASLRRHALGVDVTRATIPLDEEALLGLDRAVDDRSPEQIKADQEREDDALQFAAVGVVPEGPGI